VAGRVVSVPGWDADGTLRLTENWRRLDGSSVIEEVDACLAPPDPATIRDLSG
jgi:hypothetical protein